MARVAEFAEARKHIIVAVFFAAVLAIGLVAFKDYGVAWDEPVQRQYGSEVYGYIVHHDQQLLVDRHRYYGPVFELLLYSLEKALGLNDTRPIYMMRHLVNFLVFWAGVVFFYLLCKYLFRSWKLGLLGSTFLVLSPAIFAHGFYNTKDIPFLSLFIAGVYTLVRYLDRPVLRWAAVHGAVCALLVDTRIAGILLPALTVLFLGYDAASRRRRGSEVKRAGISLGVFAAVWAGGTVLLWPTLWRDPIKGFVQGFEGMQNFPWEATVLYLGRYVWATNLPWHYTPVWIGVSTPLAYVILFAVGLAVAAKSVVWTRSIRSSIRGDGVPKDAAANRGRTERGQSPIETRRTRLLVLLWLLVPPAYYAVSRAVLYDEWRHSFFVYPALLVVSLVGLVSLWGLVRDRFHGVGRRLASSALVWLVALNLGATATFMLRYHPHQNVYFNSLVGGVKGASGKFELDYWGLSYRKGLEYILRSDPARMIPVLSANPPGRYNADILKPADRKRLVFVEDAAEAKYYITNFRWEKKRLPPEAERYAVRVGGAKLMAVYQLGGDGLGASGWKPFAQ
jgi:hypothetical protein